MKEKRKKEKKERKKKLKKEKAERKGHGEHKVNCAAWGCKCQEKREKVKKPEPIRVEPRPV